MAENTEKQKRTAPDKPPSSAEQAKGQPAETKQRSWDIIDENAWESFPASDAPGSWAGRDIPPQEREARQREKSDKEEN